MYTLLDPEKILQTATAIQARVQERFPNSGLSRISEELIVLSKHCTEEIKSIPQPVWSIRILVGLLTIMLVSAFVYIFTGVKYTETVGYSDFVQALDAAMSSLVMVGASILFLVNVEKKYKLKRALRAIHSLRSLAHVIDMHQLTKDPYQFAFPQAHALQSSPRRPMSLLELSRYYDYCSEMLSIISKVAALFPQYLDDREVLNTVDDVESLADGLSRKIWQKISMVNSLQHEQRTAANVEPVARKLAG